MVTRLPGTFGNACEAISSTLSSGLDAAGLLSAHSGATIAEIASIDTGKASPSTVYEDNGSIVIDGRELIENNRPDDSIDQWTLTQGYMYSLNVVFAQIGLDVGATDLEKYAAAFGFGSGIPYDLPIVESQLATKADFLRSQVALAETAFGQGQILASPMQMALIAACIANDGQMMQPYLVQEIETQSGNHLRSVDPSVWRTPISSATAQSLQQMMIEAVEQGTVSGAAVPGYTVGGKTGTAETGSGDPHSWFIGFIGDPEPRYAVAVVLEHGGGEVGAAVSIGQGVLADVIATN